MMMDNSISKKVNPGDFTLRNCCDFTKILLNEIPPARNSLLLLAVFEELATHNYYIDQDMVNVFYICNYIQNFMTSI